MPAARVLVVEDDRHIRDGLVDTLESEGYVVTAVPDGSRALRVLATAEFDLVILDIMMPGKSGYDVCAWLRGRDEAIPIIMLTAKAEETDKVVGLKLGADDYITKPFGVRELLARIDAVLRRSHHASPRRPNNFAAAPDTFRFGAATVNAREYRLRLGEVTHDLSDRELRLLQYFHAHPNEVLSRDRLLTDVWGMGYYGTTRTLDQHISQLRKKVESDATRPTVIRTVHGVGYRYQCP